jgi:hexulose-6-phosphate isomerase
VADINGFVDLLSGDVDFPAVVEALEKVGYTDYASAEMVPPAPFYKHYSDQIVYSTSAAMDRILGRK